MLLPMAVAMQRRGCWCTSAGSCMQQKGRPAGICIYPTVGQKHLQEWHPSLHAHKGMAFGETICANAEHNHCLSAQCHHQQSPKLPSDQTSPLLALTTPSADVLPCSACSSLSPQLRCWQSTASHGCSGSLPRICPVSALLMLPQVELVPNEIRVSCGHLCMY